MAIKIVHCCREKFDIYIGRWNPRFPIKSKWANPFIIGKDGDRAEVIKKYEKYLLSRSDLLKALPELKDKVIACWCAPKPCHGHILKKHAEAILS